MSVQRIRSGLRVDQDRFERSLTSIALQWFVVVVGCISFGVSFVDFELLRARIGVFEFSALVKGGNRRAFGSLLRRGCLYSSCKIRTQLQYYLLYYSRPDLKESHDLLWNLKKIVISNNRSSGSYLASIFAYDRDLSICPLDRQGSTVSL